MIRLIVGDNELVFVIRNRRFAEILGPGDYWIFTAFLGLTFERHNTRELVLNSEWTDTLVRQHADLTARHFVVIETGDHQVALVYLDGRLTRVVPPAKRVVYFRGQVDVTFEVIDVRAEPEVPARIL